MGRKRESGQVSPVHLLAHFCKVCRYMVITSIWSGFTCSLITGSSAGQNPQPQKIPAIRTSWLARSFLWLPHYPRFIVFFCHVFCNQPFFHSDVFFKNHYFNPR
jgi:hypothetical protein